MTRSRFKTTLRLINGWTIAVLPKEVSAALPSRGQVMVEGMIRGFEFKTPMEPDGRGGHWLHVDEGMLTATGLTAGGTAELEVEASKAWSEPVVPKDVQAALAKNPDAGELWNVITPMARWEWLRWINSTQNPQTRARRIEVGCSKLKSGERRPCCFNRNMCCVPDVSKNGVLLTSD